MILVWVNLVYRKQIIGGDMICSRKEYEEYRLCRKLFLRVDGNQKYVEEFLGVEMMNLFLFLKEKKKRIVLSKEISFENLIWRSN